MYVFVVKIVVKQVSGYLTSMGVKTEHTVDGQNHASFKLAYLMVIPAKRWATTNVIIAQMYALVHRNLMVYTEN